MWYMNDERRKFQQEVRKFVQEEVKPQVPFIEEKDQGTGDLMRKIAKRGWLKLPLDKPFSKNKPDWIKYGILLEELGKESPTLGMNVSAMQFNLAMLISEGREYIIDKYVKPSIAGDILMGEAGNESTGANNLPTYSTVAKKAGDDWIINGTKTFITKADIVDYMILNARIDGSDKLHSFVISMKAPGVQVGHIEKKIGLHGSRTGAIYLDNVRVSDKDLFKNADGYAATAPLMGLDGLMDLGASEAVIEKAKTQIKERTRNGKSLWDEHETTQTAFGALEAQVLVLKNHLFSYLADVNNQDPIAPIEAMTSKAEGGRVFRKISEQVILLSSGFGIIYESGLERYHRDAIAMIPTAGSDVTFYNAIGNSLSFSDEKQTGQYNRKNKAITGSLDDQVDEIYKQIEQVESDSGKSKIVLAVGRGIKSKKTWENVKTIARKIGATVGGTRAFLESPLSHNKSLMIGISGTSIKPDLVINFAISGSQAYSEGIKDAKEIISINDNPNAEIFYQSDLSIVADVNELIEKLLDKFADEADRNENIFGFSEDIIVDQYIPAKVQDYLDTTTGASLQEDRAADVDASSGASKR